MEKRKLGTSDLYVSELGLGCMSLGKEKQQAISIIDAAIANGITFLDTADLYNVGLNEEFVGAAIKAKRHEIILATKVGNRWKTELDGWYWDPSKKYIKNAVKNSLRRLQTDYIDLYQLHGGTIEDNFDETIEAFEDLKKEGVIRYYGISSIRPNVIREYVKKANIVSVMMQYSILDRRPEDEILSLLEAHGISMIARGPLAKGLLTNRPLEKAKPSILENGYQDYPISELTKVIMTLKREFPSRSLTEVAIHYVLHHKNVACAIPGASKLEQLLENCAAIHSPAMTEEEYKHIQQLTKPSIYQNHR